MAEQRFQLVVLYRKGVGIRSIEHVDLIVWLSSENSLGYRVPRRNCDSRYFSVMSISFIATQADGLFT